MQENLNSQKQNTALPFKISDDILRELDLALKEESKSKNNSQTEIEINELEIDFLPLTNGLGFHQPEEKKIQAHFTQKNIKKTSMPVYNQPLAIKLETQNQTTDRADLSPFYNSGKNSFDLNPLFSDSDFQKLKASTYKDPKTANLTEEQTKAKASFAIHFEKANLQDQISAWAIDLGIISILLLATVYLNFALSGFYKIEQIKSLMTALEGVTYFAPLFIFYYLFYFTILDREGSLTIGKKIMGIQIRSLRGDHLGFTQTFLRAAITLLSVMALGLPLLMDFQGKLTDSEVIKK